jgi:hypothetical protein
MTTRTLRRITDRDEQDAETYRYWQSRSCEEIMAAVEELTRSGYASKGIDLDVQGSERTLVRVQRTRHWTQAALCGHLEER